MKRRDILTLTMVLTCSLLLVSCGADEAVEVANSNPTQIEQSVDTEPEAKIEEIKATPEVVAPVEVVTPAEVVKVDLNETVYATTSVNVRPVAGTDGDSVGHLYSGDSVVRQEIVGEWSRIDFNGGTAYVKSEYLSTTAPVVAPVTTPKKSGGGVTPKKSGGGTTSSGNTGSGTSETTVSGNTGSGDSGGGETTTTKPPSTAKSRTNHWGEYLTSDAWYGTVYSDRTFQSGYEMTVPQYNAFKSAGRIASAPYTHTYPDGHTEECVGEYLTN